MIAWCDGNPGKKVCPTAGSDDYYQISQIIKKMKTDHLLELEN